LSYTAVISVREVYRFAGIQVKRLKYPDQDLIHLPVTFIQIEWIGGNERGIEIIHWSDE